VEMYERALDANLQELCARIHTGRYWPQPVRRVSSQKQMADSDHSVCQPGR
jgi:hypothetical protein